MIFFFFVFCVCLIQRTFDEIFLWPFQFVILNQQLLFVIVVILSYTYVNTYILYVWWLILFFFFLSGLIFFQVNNPNKIFVKTTNKLNQHHNMHNFFRLCFYWCYCCRNCIYLMAEFHYVWRFFFFFYFALSFVTFFNFQHKMLQMKT